MLDRGNGRAAEICRLRSLERNWVSLVVIRIDGHQQRGSIAGAFLAFAEDVGGPRQGKDHRGDIFVAHADAAVRGPQPSVPAQCAAVYGKRRTPIRFGDGGFSMHGLQNDHSAAPILGDVEGSSATCGHNAPNPVASNRRVAVGQGLQTSGIVVLAGRQIICAGAHREWSREGSSPIIFNPKSAGVASIRGKLDVNSGHEQNPSYIPKCWSNEPV